MAFFCCFLAVSQPLEARALGEEAPKLAGASDKTLAGDVLGALQNDASLALAATDVQVTAENGEVQLIGTTPSEEDKSAIEKKASAISGVARVINHLRIIKA